MFCWKRHETYQTNRSRAMSDTCFVIDSIHKRLAELREDCAVKRLIKFNAFERRWARAARTDQQNEADCGPSDSYWDDRQAKAQTESTNAVVVADAELSQFIAEHRHIMGPDWIGNDHGRLCWGHFLGGRPIGQHYCQREEGHDGFCQNDVGAWPKGIHGEPQWWRVKKACAHESKIEWQQKTCCEQCGQVL